MSRGSIKDAAIILGGPDRQRLYDAIARYDLGALLEQIRDAKTPDQIRIEQARKELRSHG